MTSMITATPPANGNPGTVPPWLSDPVMPLPDPIGDTPMILPIDDDDWQHQTFVLNRVAHAEFRCDEGGAW